MSERPEGWRPHRQMYRCGCGHFYGWGDEMDPREAARLHEDHLESNPDEHKPVLSKVGEALLNAVKRGES